VENIHRRLERPARHLVLDFVAIVAVASLVLCFALPAGGRAAANPKDDPYGGYAVINETNPYVLTSGSTTFVLPSSTCKKKGAVGFGVELVAAMTSMHLTRADVAVNCLAKKKVEFTTDAYLDGDLVPSEIASMHPGDTVAVAVTCDGAGTSVSVNDENTGFTYSQSSASPADCDAAQTGGVGVCANSSCTRQEYLPDFGMVTFSDALVNGEALGGFERLVEQYFEGNKNQFGPGPLVGGTAFTLHQT